MKSSLDTRTALDITSAFTCASKCISNCQYGPKPEGTYKGEYHESHILTLVFAVGTLPVGFAQTPSQHHHRTQRRTRRNNGKS